MFRLTLIWTASLMLFPILLIQGVLTRRRAVKLPEAPGPRHGGEAGDLIVVFGDSVVAGVGVSTTSEALPAKLTASLVEQSGQEYQWRAVGSNGDRVEDLVRKLPQIAFLEQKPALVVVNVGVNDVSKLTSMVRWQLHLTTLISEAKQKLGVPIVFLGLPPMHAFPLLPEPLRFVLGVRAKMLDLNLERMAKLIPGVFYLKTDLSFEPEYMAVDGYHPSAAAIDVWTRQLASELIQQGALQVS